MTTIRIRTSTPSHGNPSQHWTDCLRRCCQDGYSHWGDIEMVEPGEPADWTLIVNHAIGRDADLDPARCIVMQWEPAVVRNGGWGTWEHPETGPWAATWTIRERHMPLDWYISQSYPALVHAPCSKWGTLSACQTTKTHHPGHRLRHEFATGWLTQLPYYDHWEWPIDFDRYRGKPPMRAKDDALLPYKYHFCAENSTEPHYSTEKLGDAFLAHCLPLYWGAPDIYRWFPEDSLILLPLEDPGTALEIVKRAVRDGAWEKRLSAIAEARHRVLTKYSVWACVERLLAELEAKP